MTADFENYSDIYAGVDAASIRAAADDVRIDADVIAALAGELSEDDQHVASDIEGDIQAGTRANPQQVAAVATNLAQQGHFAVGVLNLFADHVASFDQTVDDLNQRLAERAGELQTRQRSLPDEDRQSWNELCAATKRELQGEYDRALAQLDEDADSVATAFERGATPERVEELLRAGYIPLAQAGLWPEISLSPSDRQQALQNAIDNGTLPDFATLTTAETQAYLQSNPGLSESLLAIMGVPGLSPSLTHLVQAQAGLDADLLNGVVEGDGEWTDVAAATERLEAINQSIAEGNLLTAAQGAYIEQYLNTVGAENLAGLSTALRSAAPAGMPPYALDAVVDEAMRPVADSILNYSNPEVHRPDAGIAANHGHPATGQATVPLSSMPQAVQDLIEQRIGHPDGSGGLLGTAPDETTRTTGRGRNEVTVLVTGQAQFDTVDGLDLINGWGDLLSSASEGVQPGERFGIDLAEQAITVKQDLNTIDETAESYGHYTGGGRSGDREYHGIAFTQDDSAASDLLGVAARNEDSSSRVLLDEADRRSLLTLNWGDAEGAQALVAAGTDRSEAGGGDVALQARAAQAIMSDIAADPNAWNDRMQEEMSDSVLDVGTRWVDSFGYPAGSGDSTPDGVNENDNGPFVQLSSTSQDGFLKFVAGAGTEDAVSWQGQAQAYFDLQVRAAVESGDGSALNTALNQAANFGGRMEAATIDWVSDVSEDEHAAEVAEIVAENRERASQRAAADLVTKIVTSGVSISGGPAGPWINGTINTLSGPVFDEIFAEEDVPNYSDVDNENRQRLLADARTDAPIVLNQRIALWFAPEYASNPDFASLYADGAPLPAEDFVSNAALLSELESFRYAVENGWTAEHASSLSFDDSYLSPYGSLVENANADRDGTDAHGNPVEPATDIGDDVAMRRYLYGDNYDRWAELNRPGEESVGPRGRRSVNPESTWSTEHEHIGSPDGRGTENG